jgi:lipopolysaccharide/colanic/teichoic acid biosynthesis glycosyltransferase
MLARTPLRVVTTPSLRPDSEASEGAARVPHAGTSWRPIAPRRPPGERAVLDETPFRRLLVAERRRCVRSHEPMALLMLSVGGPHRGDRDLDWRDAIDAIASCTREADVVGWLDHARALGVVLDGIEMPEAMQAPDLEVRVRRALARRLDADVVARFSIDLHVHRAPKPPADQASRKDDAIDETLPFASRAPVYHTIKRLIDIAGSATLLVILGPLFLLIAALVKLKSTGPVFFGQMRIGRLRKPFRMLKFRTMYVNSDPGLHCEFVTWFITSSQNANPPGQNGCFKLANDPRVTPVGRVLRKLSLDELPQLWNVLRGEMSLVGPRPPLAYEVEQYKSWHARRLEIKPGITGLWQVRGRSRTTFDEMVRLDLQYAKTCSFWSDVKILLATPRAVISGKGAC